MDGRYTEDEYIMFKRMGDNDPYREKTVAKV